MSNKPKVIDLFSGCGGFSYGFQSAGFDIVCGVDNIDITLKTFKKNHKNSKTLVLDLSDKSSIDKIIKNCNVIIDVIIAGPPCQGFSLTGTRDKNDKRNQLFYAVFQLAEKIKPKIIIIENVPGLVKLYKGKAKDEILRRSEEIGYNCDYQVLYAPDYGVPQIRKRVFFVATRKDLPKFNFPKPLFNPNEYITCEMAIGDLPSLEDLQSSEKMKYKSLPSNDYQKLMRHNSKAIFNHVVTNHSSYVIDVISQVPEGGNYKDLPPGVGDSRKFNEAWTRYHSQKPSKTIDTGHRNHFHYKWNRIPTARENARLQSFPDTFVFYGNKTEQYAQIGNAVPPLLGKAIAKQVLKVL